MKIPVRLRATIGASVIGQLMEEGHRVLCGAVGEKHVHALVELPDCVPFIRKILGRCKNASSRAVRKELPGQIWGEGGKWKPVKSRAHLLAAFGYIRDEQGPGAWTWTFREVPPPDPRRKRRREAVRPAPKTAVNAPSRGAVA